MTLRDASGDTLATPQGRPGAPRGHPRDTHRPSRSPLGPPRSPPGTPRIPLRPPREPPGTPRNTQGPPRDAPGTPKDRPRTFWKSLKNHRFYCHFQQLARSGGALGCSRASLSRSWTCLGALGASLAGTWALLGRIGGGQVPPRDAQSAPRYAQDLDRDAQAHPGAPPDRPTCWKCNKKRWFFNDFKSRLGRLKTPPGTPLGPPGAPWGHPRDPHKPSRSLWVLQGCSFTPASVSALGSGVP